MRDIQVLRIKLENDRTMADFYRTRSKDQKMQDFLALQQTHLAATGLTQFPRIERVITFRKMK
ncbi:MAG: hypothetical protein JSR44_04325 [Spirochaetes bacterium]|nr:hypothetical protein [Spirochaetota bacterium]